MYFNNNKNTNIDHEFKNNNNLSKILISLKKYKKLIFIGIGSLILVLLIILLFLNKKSVNYLNLNGDEYLTIYQGADYIESGFEAYNSKNENLNSKVIIKSNLDTDKIGEYEITYTIGEISKIRKITVIKKPKEYIYIYLKTVNNNIDLYLNVGEEYIEPGYQVFSSTGKNLTNEVKITGTVDTTKTGNYKIIYSVIDSNNVTITASRTVIVMDSEINLTLSTHEYTNKDITINIEVIDNYYDYMILPNNTKIMQNKYSYNVNENGTYTIKVYNKKGFSKESSSEVKNIDKTPPTGSCSGTYKSGKSTITINANDNSEIDKYIVNGNSYTTNKIAINKELKSINATIYDKAGNTKNISCSLENKNEQHSESNNSSSDTNVSKPSSAKNDPIYKQEEYHDNSINGVRYILYDQADSRWGTLKYSDGDTMKSAGCMVTTMAVISSAYDTNITPQTVFYSKHRWNWTSTAVNDFTNNKISCKRKSSMTKEEIISNLKLGNVVAIKVKNPNKYAKTQHYMALIDIKKDNSQVFVGNKSGRTHGWLNTNDVLYNMHEFHICEPTETVIDKFK